MKRIEQGARNSIFRPLFSGITNGTAKWLIKTFPGITANEVTYTGLGSVVVGSAIKTLPKDLISPKTSSLLSLGLIAFGVLCDGFDGAVSRNKDSKNHDSIKGALTDVMSDRFGETAMVLSRIFAAGARKDPFGVVAATISGITAPLPSLLRAMVEKQGSFVPESGGNPLSFLGNRATRSILTIPATTFPEIEISGISCQPILDSISILGNVASTIERINKKASRKELKTNPDIEAKQLGEAKVKLLTPYALINAAALLAVGTLELLTMK